ncbi:MAG: glycosyltransferase [Fibrobacteria bacterium]|nr:glycosyltransferase [Fibrobacteria bacterium]
MPGIKSINTYTAFFQKRLVVGLSLFLLLVTWFFIGRLGPVYDHFPLFIFLYLLSWAFGLIFFVALPKGISKKETVFWILMAAVLCRAFLFSFPVSDDVNRYLWEGKMIKVGVNPYAMVPQDESLTQYRDEVWEGINHKDMGASYPPGVLYLFFLASHINYQFGFFKAMFIVFDLGTLLFLFILLKHKRKLRYGVFYGLNPLILFSFSGQAHYDSVMLFFMCTSLVCYVKKRWVLMFFLLGLAFQAKYFALLILPFMVKRENIRYAWGLAVTIILPYVPFLLDNPLESFRSLVRFGTGMAHNGSLHWLIRSVFGSIELATGVCALLFLLVYFRLFKSRSQRRPIASMALVFLAFIILSPTIHFWYVSWIIPFICFYPGWPLGILFLSLSFYFIADCMMMLTGTWYQPVSYLLAQWIPFYTLLLWHNRYRFTTHKFWKSAEVPSSYSIVIPVFNSAPFLKSCLAHLKTLSPLPSEVIVVDGGSTDGSLEISKEAKVRLIQSVKGRGQQIAAGIESVQSDITMVLHSDTRIGVDVPERILHAFKEARHLIGGAVGQRFWESGLVLSLVEFLNDLRAGLFGISFGDQVQFVRTDAAKDFKLMPKIPLMEDVEMSWRMGKYGKRSFLWGGAEVSNYKWKRGASKRFTIVLYLMVVYFFRKFTGKKNAGDLYKLYYK